MRMSPDASCASPPVEGRWLWTVQCALCPAYSAGPEESEARGLQGGHPGEGQQRGSSGQRGTFSLVFLVFVGFALSRNVLSAGRLCEWTL